MAFYKAKDSYLKLKDDKNFNGLGSPSKHNKLVKGELVNITDVPKSLEKHLERDK
tara:strand:- start:1059 stop:1223 length:165 start_codon:yes stop_codon:yes gene_type:complete